MNDPFTHNGFCLLDDRNSTHDSQSEEREKLINTKSPIKNYSKQTYISE
jgi:hypothetical protein